MNSVNKQFKDLIPTLEFYKEDLLHTSRDILEAEWHLWVSHWKNTQNTLPKHAVEALKMCDAESFPNIKILLTILAVIPVTTASVERSFSTLKRLKTYLRNKTGEDRFTSIALMTVHRNVHVNVEEIVIQYIQGPTRLRFS